MSSESTIQDRRVLRLAVVGCGAVTEMRYLPALERVPDISLTHLVDLDRERARALGEAYGLSAGVAEDYREVLESVDGVVVATPPASHRQIVIDCLSAGKHVLCEKPLAPNLTDAVAIAEAAREAKGLLSVGMVRRYGRGAALLHRCLKIGMAGDLSHVEAEEGGEFTWPQRTRHAFDSEQGGVLRDTGVHILDLVFWLVDGESAEVTGCEDDSWGGPEANARVEMEVDAAGGTVSASVEVSFTRELENKIRVFGSNGRLEADSRGGTEVRFFPEGSTETVHVVPGDGSSRSRVDDFVLQVEEFGSAVREGGPPPVSAGSTLLPLRVIDNCHESSRRVVRSWEEAPANGNLRETEGAARDSV